MLEVLLAFLSRGRECCGRLVYRRRGVLGLKDVLVLLSAREGEGERYEDPVYRQEPEHVDLSFLLLRPLEAAEVHADTDQYDDADEADGAPVHRGDDVRRQR